MTRIYLSPPHMSGREEQFVREAFASNWIAPLGPQVDAFEQEFAAASARRMRWRSAPARPRCIWRCCWPAWGWATRCWSPR